MAPDAGSEDDEDDEEWAEVAQHTGSSSTTGSTGLFDNSEGHLEITIDGRGGRRKTRAQLDANRIARQLALDVHRAHVLCWLAHGHHLNAVCDNVLVQATLLSLTSSHLVSSTTTTTLPSGGSLRAALVTVLTAAVKWWRTFVQEVHEDGLAITNAAEFMATLTNGRPHLLPADSAMLFVAWLRALGFQARLVVALQPVPFRPAEVKTFKQRVEATSASLKEPSPPATPPQQPAKVPARRTRRTIPTDASEQNNDNDNNTTPPRRRKRQLANSSSNSSPSTATNKKRKSMNCDSINTATYIWAEVLLPQENVWVPVDAIRELIDQPVSQFTALSSARLQSHYIVAWLPLSRYIKDVTRRYAAGTFTAKTRRQQQQPWWSDTVMQQLSARPDNVELDRLENEQLYDAVLTEGVPNTVSALLNHPLYVLERHLKKFEIIHPRRPEDAVGQLRDELIFRRQQVQILHTADKWLSLECRVVRPGEVPVKLVKSRAMPQRSLRIAGNDSDDDDEAMEGPATISGDGARQVGLFGEWQTDEYKPAPIVNGIIPKNKYQNMDLFKPAMLPPGSVHLVEEALLQAAGLPAISRLKFQFRTPTLKKVCRGMPDEVDFAEAVVGFDYHSGRSVPRVSGVVIAAENEEAVTREYIKQLLECLDKEVAVREQQAVARWDRLTKKLMIRSRLRAQFGDG